MIEGVGAVSAISQAFLAPPTDTARPQPSTDAVKAFDYHIDLPERQPPDWQVIKTSPAGGRAEFERNDGGLGAALVQAITEMDANYRDTISRIQHWPGFSAYLDKHGIEMDAEDGAKPSGYRHISNVDAVSAAQRSDNIEPVQILERGIDKMNEISAKTQAYYNAGMEYEYDSAKWFLTTEFWMTKVKILTSAVTQVSNSLRTLFNSQ